MGFFDPFIAWFINSIFITKLVIFWLLVYFILTFTIFFSRNLGLSIWIQREQKALRSYLMGTNLESVSSSLQKCIKADVKKEQLQICASIAQKEATRGLTWLSIIASTSPFIGLFGTVISILVTFSKLGSGNSSLSVIAPAISEALIATGVGIFVAIPAYTFHLLIKRKAHELVDIIDREVDIVVLSSSLKKADSADV